MINYLRRNSQFSRKVIIILVISVSSITGAFLNMGFAETAAQNSTVIVPINYAFPLIPVITITSAEKEPFQSSSTGIIIGSDGTAVIIRVSSRD